MLSFARIPTLVVAQLHRPDNYVCIDRDVFIIFSKITTHSVKNVANIAYYLIPVDFEIDGNLKIGKEICASEFQDCEPKTCAPPVDNRGAIVNFA